MPKTVLIVEDDYHLRAVYAAAVANHGYNVITAIHGAEGVHLARKHRPDIILLDFKMPVMDGETATRYLRSYPETANIPIVIVSAYPAGDGEGGPAAAISFSSRLSKPVDLEQLNAEIEDCIGPPQRDAAQVHPFP